MGLMAWIRGEEPNIFNQWLHSDDTGHFGEYLIDYALNSVPGYAQKLCNLYLPYKNRTSEIDVVMLHETGIYVFESKNYSGWIFGNEKDQYWTQCLNVRTKNRFYNPILQNRTHIKALQEYLELSDTENIISYIVFSQRCELKNISSTAKNTVIVKRPAMLESLRKEVKKHTLVFTPEQIDQMYDALLPFTDTTAEEREIHIENIHQPKGGKKEEQEQKTEESPMLCPKCGASMVLRTASKGTNKGKQFYGCSNFPKCRQIINIE